MAKALTAKSVEQAKPGADRREIPDGLLPGFYLVIQPSGAKSWAVRYRYGGKPKKLTIGSVATIDLADAREEAREALKKVSKGIDPGAEKKAAKADAADERKLFENVAVDFIERYSKRRNRAWDQTARRLGLKPDPAHAIDAEGNEVAPRDRPLIPSAEGPVAEWKGRPIQSITRRDVVALLDAIADRGHGIAANRALAAIRKLFNWAAERDLIAASPCVGVKAPSSESERERVLSDDEIRWLWHATEAHGYPFGPLVRMLLLTGQRREEVAGMTSAEISIGEQHWLIPSKRTKNGREHLVPLSGAALAEIEALPRIKGKAGYLFTSTGETHVTGYSRAKDRINAKMHELARREAEERGEDPAAVTIERWTLHDLRRTAASRMGQIGIPPHIVEAVLNHKTGVIQGVAAVYQRYSYADEKRAALDAWARFLALLADANLWAAISAHLSGDANGKRRAFMNAINEGGEVWTAYLAEFNAAGAENVVPLRRAAE